MEALLSTLVDIDRVVKRAPFAEALLESRHGDGMESRGR
jgi:hypothetical protein